jgi:hypothetical protein
LRREPFGRYHGFLVEHTGPTGRQGERTRPPCLRRSKSAGDADDTQRLHTRRQGTRSRRSCRRHPLAMSGRGGRDLPSPTSL